MGQVKKEVVPVQVDYICDKCNEGKMRPTGQCYPMSPPKYPHRCDKEGCDGAQTFSRTTYPYIDYIHINE